MEKSKYGARIDNVYFLSRLGEALRWATDDIAHEELPVDIQRLLARLERLEAQARRKDTHREPSGPSETITATVRSGGMKLFRDPLVVFLITTWPPPSSPPSSPSEQGQSLPLRGTFTHPVLQSTPYESHSGVPLVGAP